MTNQRKVVARRFFEFIHANVEWSNRAHFDQRFFPTYLFIVEGRDGWTYDK